MGFGRSASEDGKPKKAPKIWRRQRTVAEDDKYGFKAQRRSEERAKILRGNGW